MLKNAPSLGRALRILLANLAILAGPAIAAAILPMQVSLPLILVLFTMMWGLASRLPRVARAALDILPGSIVGLSLRLAFVLSTWWGVAAAAATGILGLACIGHIERRLGWSSRPRRTVARAPNTNLDTRQTPEGGILRILDQGEIAMGGPVFHTILFPDGIVLCGIGLHACFSRNGRYFAASMPSRKGNGLIVLDRHAQKTFYDAETASFWSIEEFAVTGTEPLRSAQESPSPELAAWMATAREDTFLQVADLLLEREQWEDRIHAQVFRHPSPQGDHMVEARLDLPVSLMALAHPLHPLIYPGYRLSLDGQTSELLTCSPSNIAWHASGTALACQAHTAEEAHHRTAQGGWQRDEYWHWSAQAGWRALPALYESLGAGMSITETGTFTLDEDMLWIDAVQDNPEISGDGHGYSLYTVHSASAMQTGHEEDGQMALADYPCPPLRLGMAVAAHQPLLVISTSAMSDGMLPTFTQSGQWHGNVAGWHCRIGAWQVPGHWLLDHRVSNCRRHIALSHFPPVSPPGHGPVAGSCFVATPDTRALRRTPDMLLARLHDFTGNQLSLIRIAGRGVPDQADGMSPEQILAPYTQKAPLPQESASFFSRDTVTPYCYEVMHCRIDEKAGLVPLPPFRIALRAQAANACGSFVYPAPSKRDAAWVFGSRTQYGSGRLRKDEARQDAFLMTASGCALGGLSPCMIWSENSRFLALTRLEQTRDRSGRRAWRLMLLDVEQGVLHTDTTVFHGMPCLLSFDQDGLSWRVGNTDWRDDRKPGRVRRRSLAQLTAMPATLLKGPGLRLSPDQESWREAWRSVRATPLDPWRAPEQAQPNTA